MSFLCHKDIHTLYMRKVESRQQGPSVVISRPCSRDSSALEIILSRSRSRSRDLIAKVLVSRPEGLGLGLNSQDLKSKVSVLVSSSVVISRPWSRDSSALEFILSRSRSRSRLSRPDVQGLGFGLET